MKNWESFHPRYFKTLIKSLSNRSNLLVLIKADLSPITKWKLTGLSYYSNIQNPQIHPLQIPWSKNLLILTFHFSNFKKYLKTKSFQSSFPSLEQSFQIQTLQPSFTKSFTFTSRTSLKTLNKSKKKEQFPLQNRIKELI
jgi:hypothetical protein